MSTPASPSSLADLGAEPFVSLTTFRRSGEPVATPVWVAVDEDAPGGALVVTTPADSGKVKRLRHTARVELRPCSRRGVVADGVEPVLAVGHVLPDPAVHERQAARLLAKYGLEYRAVMLVERVLSLRPSQRSAGRVIVRLTAPA